jgi:thioesterase domain-containing protein
MPAAGELPVGPGEEGIGCEGSLIYTENGLVDFDLSTFDVFGALSVGALRPGASGRPLFIVHMVGGGIAMLRRLAAALDTQRPVYGLQARGLEPTQEPRRTVEAMAEAYTDAIRVVQPEGPYALCGYSFGGLVAFEMACQFSALGQELDFLALIDPEANPAALPRGARWRFRADEGRRVGACNPALVWRYHVQGDITVEPVSGRHADLFAQENIGPVANAVSARLRASQSVGPDQPSAK